MRFDTRFCQFNLTGVLTSGVQSSPAKSDQPISNRCVVNNDDIITMRSALTLWRYPTANCVLFGPHLSGQNLKHISRSISVKLLAAVNNHLSTVWILVLTQFASEGVTLS